MLNSKGSCRCVFLYLVVAGVMAWPASAQAGMMGILVPAYFYPTTGGVNDEWTQMTSEAGKVPITAIFNPASGPGSSTDTNYVHAITNLENAGGHVVAYVNSGDGNGSISLATIENQISTYISQYGNLIDGFFIDNMFVQPSTLLFYQSLDTYIKNLSSSYTVIGNPGQPFLNGVSPTDYLSTADVFNIFEGPDMAPSPGAAGFDAYPYGLNWFQKPSFPSSRFSNIVYGVSGVSEMLADVSKAAQLNAGYVDVTDQGTQTQSPSYDQLPSYWDQEVAAISVPEPGTLSYLASTALCWPLVLAARGRARRRSRV